MSKKVVSFSLWGDIKKYTIGALKNAELVNKLYSGYESWFYIHKDTVNQEIIDELNKIDNVKIIYKTGDLLKIKPMCWRFEPILNEDVELMLCRDTDTRIFDREVKAVEEWIKSDKLLHIMRDHKIYHRAKIFGGMFGVKKSEHIKNWKNIIFSFNQDNQERNYDCYILNKILELYNQNEIFIHSTYKKFKGETIHPFPTKYNENFDFIGCYVNEYDERIKEYHDLLKN